MCLEYASTPRGFRQLCWPSFCFRLHVAVCLCGVQVTLVRTTLCVTKFSLGCTVVSVHVHDKGQGRHSMVLHCTTAHVSCHMVMSCGHSTSGRGYTLVAIQPHTQGPRERPLVWQGVSSAAGVAAQAIQQAPCSDGQSVATQIFYSQHLGSHHSPASF